MAYKPYPYHDQVKPDGQFVHAETKKNFEFVFNSVAPFAIEVNGKLEAALMRRAKLEEQLNDPNFRG